MNKELKPCPFCGGEAVINVIEPHEHVVVNLPPYPGGAFIECTGCTCAMSGQSEEEVIEAWNTRKPIDKVVEQLEAIQNFEMRTGQGYCPDANEEECRYRYSDLGCRYCAFEKAIEIVKGGAE